MAPGARMRGSSAPGLPGGAGTGAVSAANAWLTLIVVFLAFVAVGYGVGYGVGWATTNLVFSTTRGVDVPLGVREDPFMQRSTPALKRHRPVKYSVSVPKHLKGDTIHSVLTSSGDAYQNFQTRIMYGTYKLVQKEPGGDHLTGFTRILHRTVPDVLMDEVPTFMAKPLKPQCDGWCDYPVANRPSAILQFFQAAAANASMITGAWVFMLECDYVWMQPMQVPGDAHDPRVPGVQFLFDYIIPTHPNCVPQMKKLYPGDPEDIPASGPAPVLLRLADWQAIVPDYVRLSEVMEADAEMKEKLGWVREMYAWDAAVALHRHIPVRTELHTNSSTIVQPPFDEALGRAALCHYTWGALYHEGLPSKGGKQVYRWEKRDYNDPRHVLRVPRIPMPPAYKEGWILEFDAPLTRPRHDLVVLMLAQMNKAIDTLPDLTQHAREFEPRLKEFERLRDVEAARQAALVRSSAGLGGNDQRDGQGWHQGHT